jgi:hypothetical protein
MQGRIDEGPDGAGSLDAVDDALSYAAYASARERFLARLHEDSQMRRLEAAWRLPAAVRPRASGRAPERRP